MLLGDWEVIRAHGPLGVIVAGVGGCQPLATGGTAGFLEASSGLPTRVHAAGARPTQQRAGIGAGACHCRSSRGAAAWTCAFAARPSAGAQERRSWRPARSLAVKAGVVCVAVVAPSSGIHGAGVAGHAAPPPPGTAPVCRRSARQGFPSVRSIRLAWWSTGPRCGLTDDFSAPCWSVRRKPTPGG